MNKTTDFILSKMMQSNYVKTGVKLCMDYRIIDALKNAPGPISPHDLANMMNFKEPLVNSLLRFLHVIDFTKLHEGNLYSLNIGWDKQTETLLHAEYAKAEYVKSLKGSIDLFKSILTKDGPDSFTPDESFNVWQSFSQEFEFMNPMLAEEVAKLVKKHKPDAKVVLDGGCGTGGFSDALAKELGLDDFYACDFMEKNITLCQQKYLGGGKKLIFDVKNLESLDYDPKKFDVIVLKQVLHDLVNIPKVLDQISKVLKDDGIVISVDPDVYSDQQMNVGNTSCAEAELINCLICKPSTGCKCHGVDGGLDGIMNYVKDKKFGILEGPTNILGAEQRFHSALVYRKDKN